MQHFNSIVKVGSSHGPESIKDSYELTQNFEALQVHWYNKSLRF